MQSAPHPKRFGRYEVVGVLAQGGMAELFLAQLPGIQGFAKRVVLKRVLPSLARDREFVEMFLEEARLAATLHHQNIVQVHDIGHDETGYFFTMEYLHGADVGELMRTLAQPLALPIALEIARLACAGLHYAHERKNPTGQRLGIVHRDVSPQNLFVTFDGNVKVLDFGIAKAVQQIANQYTRSGTLRGKLPYMSPEQCQSEKIDARSDVFSMAIVIWEMTVGRRLFGSVDQSDFEILKSIVERDATRPSTLIANYPPELERIVMKGLARDRAGRYQTADEMQADLEQFIRTTGWAITAREMAAQLKSLFAERAASSMRFEASELAAEAEVGQIVPFPRTATVPQEPGTMELPLGGGTTGQSDPSGPSLAPRSMPLPSPSPSNHQPQSMSPRQRTFALALAGVGIAALALAVGYRLRGASTSTTSPATTKVPSETGPGSNAGVGSNAAASSAGSAGSATVTPVAGGAAMAPVLATSGPPATEDAHWFVPGDYLVSDVALGNGRTAGIRIAKMMSKPDANGSAVFLDSSGKEAALKHYWASHIAKPGDLVLGAIAFCPVHLHRERGETPKTKQEMRMHPWSAGRITDIADVRNGLVQIASVVCDVTSTRIPDVPTAITTTSE